MKKNNQIRADCNQPLLMTGNEAMAESAVRAGCQLYAGYPITPQNELTAYMAKRMPEEKRIFIQAESELAAINMVYGASAVGRRAMTSSSSPGISLKQEGISYLAGSQLPAVIINVVRGGPGLGNIASSQSDYFQATRGGGHGDYYTPVLAPAGVQEAAELTGCAFDLADFYRTPVLILADAIVGQMMEPVALRARRSAHSFRKNWALGKKKKKPQNIIRSLLIKEGALEAHNQKLLAKWNTIKNKEQRYSTYKAKDADYLIIAYGSQARIAQAAVDSLRSQKVKAGLFRPVSLWPYPAKALKEIAKGAKKILVVEQSLGQMVEDVRLTLGDSKIYFIGRAGGGIPQETEIVNWIKKNL
ncbi:MAG: 3-methyl-2-oxobutanoate dehydrogenase subunit VorB [Candidatus Omnitrophica bacterium]|nr:3-methyl-2-oxobutanoate dehydrogenase subunit VorB [Candidatus Omnitrophota bacterium]